MQHIGTAIKDVLTKSGLKKAVEEGKVFKIWKKAVSEKIAENTTLISVNKGVITIKTHNSVWKQELQCQKFKIINNLNNKLNKAIIREIKFK